MTEDRQLPSQEEVLLFLNRFLERFYPGCQLPSESAKSVVSVDLTGSLALDVELAGRELGSDVSSFGKDYPAVQLILLYPEKLHIDCRAQN